MLITNRTRTPVLRIAAQLKKVQPIFRRYRSGPFGYTQAKALVYSKYGEPADVLYLHTHSISPLLPPESILLRTLASPINPADVNQIQGFYPTKPSFTPLLGTTAESAVCGNEGCFEAVAVGSTVKTLTKGDWVVPKNTCFGSWRTHVLAHVDDVLRIEKEGLTPAQVSTVSINPCTAYRMLKDFVKLEPGDLWIQNGANSGVGRAAIQLGKLWGLRSINIIRDRTNPAETEALRHELLNLGATHVFTERQFMSGEFRAHMVNSASGGRDSIKLALNCVGGKAASPLMRCLSKHGHLVTYGAMSRKPIEVPASQLIFNDLRLSGFWISQWAACNPTEKRRMIHEILSLIRAGSFKDVPFEEVPWKWDTDVQVLKDAVQRTLGGFKAGKGIFTFADT